MGVQIHLKGFVPLPEPQKPKPPPPMDDDQRQRLAQHLRDEYIDVEMVLHEASTRVSDDDLKTAVAAFLLLLHLYRELRTNNWNLPIPGYYRDLCVEQLQNEEPGRYSDWVSTTAGVRGQPWTSRLDLREESPPATCRAGTPYEFGALSWRFTEKRLLVRKIREVGRRDIPGVWDQDRSFARGLLFEYHPLLIACLRGCVRHSDQEQRIAYARGLVDDGEKAAAIVQAYRNAGCEVLQDYVAAHCCGLELEGLLGLCGLKWKGGEE